ncbi:MAG: hypothetical protein Q9212_000515 [Teloschistes hypoglaucus]
MSKVPHEVEEREPLLSEASQPEPRVWSRSIKAWRETCSHPSTPVLVCTCLLQFLISFAKHIVEVPTIRLFELAACHRYYGRSVDDRLCKAPAVQNELSTLTGWKFGLDAVPGLLLAIYYGSVASKYGRKPVLLLFSTGMLLSLGWVVLICWLDGRVPVRLIWLSSLFMFVGGGQKIAKAMLFTSISDAVDASHRTRYMSFLSSIPHITTLIAPPLSATFMRISIWLPFEASIGALALSYVVILAMPESSKLEPHDNANDEDGTQRPLLPTDSDLTPEVYPPIEAQKASSSHWYSEIRHLLSIPGLRFCFIVFFVSPIALLAKIFVYQHASESFGWDMPNTTWLRVSQAVGASIVTLFLLPILNALLLRRHKHHKQGLRARKLDLAVLRGSFPIAAAGFAILWRAKASWMLVLALFVCGLSEAIQPANQALATAPITKDLNARLFTTAAVLETVGKLAGGPIQSALFSIGRREGHGSLGINFLASSAIFVGLFLVAMVMRVKR